MASKLVSRSEMRSYMNVAKTGDAQYELIGEGFTSFSESKNPTEYSRQYVHEKTERTDIIGYAPQIAYSTDTYTENPVIERIREVTDEELIGTDAQVDIVNVNLFDAHTDGEGINAKTTYTAYKRTYAIVPDAKGDGTEALIYSGNFRAASDITKGTWADDTKTFTADA